MGKLVAGCVLVTFTFFGGVPMVISGWYFAVMGVGSVWKVKFGSILAFDVFSN
jgi:hypothetical protein